MWGQYSKKTRRSRKRRRGGQKLPSGIIGVCGTVPKEQEGLEIEGGGNVYVPVGALKPEEWNLFWKGKERFWLT